MRDAIQRALFGMPHADASAMLAALWDGLAASGVPLKRALVALRTLHPQIVGLGYLWEAGRGVVRNEHPHGELDLVRFQNSPLRVLFAGGGPLRHRLDGDASLPYPVLDELRALGLTDYIAQVLRFTDGRCHALTLSTDVGAGFSDADAALIGELVPILSLALEVHETRRLAGTLLDTYIGARAGRKVLEGNIRRGHVELIDAVLLSCDLRGFTALSADVGPPATVAALNEYFDRVCAPIVAGGGEILKFIGDGLLAAFPVDDAGAIAATCQAALAAARAALKALEAVGAIDLPARHLPLRAGAALHVGQVAFGNVGSPGRLDFTVIGPAVNLASRLAGLCPRLGRDLLVSGAFARQVPEGVISLGHHAVRGLVDMEEILTYP
jgi:adenylate cyclase